MRLVKSSIEHNGAGAVTLCPEEPEDMVRYTVIMEFSPFLYYINTNPKCVCIVVARL